jgi:hypothetical protein
MPKRIVVIEWDQPEYEGWLADDNIALALHTTCPNTTFKVHSVRHSRLLEDCNGAIHVGPFLETPDGDTQCAACGKTLIKERNIKNYE